MQKRKQRMKYSLGTNKRGILRNYIEDPSTALAENDIAIAKAEQKVDSNPWLKGLDMAGNLALQAGNGPLGGVLQGVNQATRYADGGTVPVEVEGEEVAETPDGSLLDFQGNSHEVGGINVDLPEGTEIFSKRIKVKGKTLADRKKKREKRVSKLRKKLAGDKLDKITKSTLEKSLANNDKEEQKDQEKQKIAKAIKQMMFANGIDRQSYAFGDTVVDLVKDGEELEPWEIKQIERRERIISQAKGSVADRQQQNQPLYDLMDSEQVFEDESFEELDKELLRKNRHDKAGLSYAYGTDGVTDPVEGDDVAPQLEPWELDEIMYRNAQMGKAKQSLDKRDQLHNLLDQDPVYEGETVDSIEGEQYAQGGTIPYMKGFGADIDPVDPDMSGIIKGVPETQRGYKVGRQKLMDFLGNAGEIAGEFNGGDAVGLAGTLYSAFKPMENTKKNRAGDTANINAFQDYGQEGLDTLDQSMEYVDDQRANTLRNLESSRVGSIQRGRNSSRGVNTNRALDLAGQLQTNKAVGDVYSNYAGQMQGLLGQKSQKQDRRDQMVMRGEDTRDTRDRQDRDNYYTQLARDISTKGEGVQRVGGYINSIKENKVSQRLINQLSKYGFRVDNKGNIIQDTKK